MPELSVTRKNISTLFSVMQGKKFIIPDYQRPYKWEKENCEILWDDIVGFFEEKKDGDEYFLGTIVTCHGKNGKSENEIHIIDGQQRITSLMLLLRAFYRKLENMKSNARITGLKSQVAPCIWDVDRISKIVKNKAKIHIESQVATESDNDVFHSILETGNHKENKKGSDLYTSNYAFFYNKCEEFAKNHPTSWHDLCVTILDNCIVLPIECDNLDLALTIFTTLNDRGMPLSDSDIFKAQIYKTKKNPSEKKNFTKTWKVLTEKVNAAEISLDDLFRYYTHIIRAKEKDKKKEIGLRKFYGLNDYALLKKEILLDDLSSLADFWIAVNKGDTHIDDVKMINDEAKKYLHCLRLYPNDFWKYASSVFFYKNKSSKDFIETFPEFLRKLTAFLFVKYIEMPTVNAIKDDIYQCLIDIIANKPIQQFNLPLKNNFKDAISETCSSKIAKALILLYAYQNPKQKTIIPHNFEIEHIFPQKWQNTNYKGWSEKAAEEYLESFGNKVAIEKKVNIHAGNGYFGKKKIKYATSTIAEVVLLSKYPSNDWLKKDIESREINFIDTLIGFFNNNLSKVDTPNKTKQHSNIPINRKKSKLINSKRKILEK